MKVNKSVETPEGEVHFEGTLSPEEVDLIIGVGLNYLLQQGAVPFKVTKASEAGQFVDGNETQQ